MNEERLWALAVLYIEIDIVMINCGAIVKEFSKTNTKINSVYSLTHYYFVNLL